MNKCNYCNREVDAAFLDRNNICHFCKKVTKWTNLPKHYNVVVHVSRDTGHWKAFYLVERSIVPSYLIASGQLPYNSLHASNNVQRMITNQLLNAVRNHYKPDPKFEFVGLVEMFYLTLSPTALNMQDVLEVVRKNLMPNLLPTLVMKTAEWNIWFPQINKTNPYEIGPIQLQKVTLHGTDQVSDAVRINTSTVIPYRPNVLVVGGEFDSRFTVTIVINSVLYTLDIVNKIKEKPYNDKVTVA